MLACSDVSFDAASRRLCFSTRHLGCLALLQDAAATVPYSSWTIRPTGGLGGVKATINIQVILRTSGCPKYVFLHRLSCYHAIASCRKAQGSVRHVTGTLREFHTKPNATELKTNCAFCVQVEGLLSAPAIDNSSSCNTDVAIEVARGTLTLLAPALPQLSHILGRPLPPCHLFAACEECGLRLRPNTAEARVAGLQEKDQCTEGAICAELALIWSAEAWEVWHAC